MFLRAFLMFLGVLAGIGAFSQDQGRAGSNLSYGSENSDPGKDIQLFPNPAPDWLHVKLGSLEASNVELSVHNIIGNELHPEVETIDDHEMRVYVKEMSPGYYFLTVKDQNSKFRGIYKFLKP